MDGLAIRAVPEPNLPLGGCRRGNTFNMLTCATRGVSILNDTPRRSAHGHKPISCNDMWPSPRLGPPPARPFQDAHPPPQPGPRPRLPAETSAKAGPRFPRLERGAACRLCLGDCDLGFGVCFGFRASDFEFPGFPAGGWGPCSSAAAPLDTPAPAEYNQRAFNERRRQRKALPTQHVSCWQGRWG